MSLLVTEILKGDLVRMDLLMMITKNMKKVTTMIRVVVVKIVGMLECCYFVRGHRGLIQR